MPSHVSRAQTEGIKVAQDKATLDWTRRRLDVRRTLVAGSVCAVYAICGGVVWSAYEEFGNQSLLNITHVVLADRTPLKRLPGQGTQNTALPARAGRDQFGATALAPAEHPAISIRQAAAPLAPSLDGAQESKTDTLVVIERPATARHHPEPAAAVGALERDKSVAAALEMPSLGLRAAAPPGSAGPATSDLVPQAQPAATWLPAPAFKPLDAVPTVVAHAMLPPQVRSKTATSGLGDNPPVPSLKPIFMASEQRPGQTSEQDTRRVSATKPSLPDAFRAFWTNLKILLASGPALRVIPAGGGNGDRRDGFANASGGGDGGTSGGASRSSNGGSSSGRGSGAGDRDSGSPSGGRSGSAKSGGGSGKGNGKSGGASANGGVSVGGGVSAGGIGVGGGVSVGGGGRSGGDEAGNGGRSGNGRGGGGGHGGGRGGDGGDGGRGDDDGGRGDGGRGDGDGGPRRWRTRQWRWRRGPRRWRTRQWRRGPRRR
jgi:uncharacterized membrane protein YgcG